MPHSSSEVRQQKKEKIENRNKALTVFTRANLVLMLNTGVTGLIDAWANWHAQQQEPLSGVEIGTQSSTLAVSILFALLAIATNRTERSKKHQELTLRAKQLKEDDKTIEVNLEREIGRASKVALNRDKLLTWSSYLLIVLFVLSTILGMVQKAQGRITDSVLPDIIGNIAYLIAMLVAFANNILGDRWQDKIEQYYLAPYMDDEPPARQGTASTMVSYLNRFFAPPAEGHERLPLVDEEQAASDETLNHSNA